MDEDDIDADLIRRIGARDTRAMDALYERHTAALYPTAARILRDDSEAEDVVQDSWLALWRDAATYDARRGSVGAWLVSMVRSRALDRAAALASRRHVAPSVGDGGAGSGPPEDQSSGPIGAPSPALKGRVMATIQAGGAESVLERSRAAERALIAAEPVAAAVLVPVAEAPHASSDASPPSAPHYPRAREPEPEPMPPPVHEAPVREPRGGMGWVWSVGWGLAIILAIVTGTLLESTGRLRAIIISRNTELNDLHRRFAVEERWAAILGFPGARLVAMSPTPGTTGTIRGRMVYAPAAQRALLVLEGASPPVGGDYEVWIVRGGSPVSQGVVTPDSRGIAVARLENFGDASLVTAFAVSLEPKGGSPTRSAPTGPYVLMGTLTN